MVTYIQVTRWKEMQCYKDRAPKWIKLPSELLDDYNFDSLSDATKFHVLGIRLLAARLDNKIPRDEAWIRAKLSAKDTIDLQAIEDAGFIEPYDGSESLVQICTDSYTEESREEEIKVEKHTYGDYVQMTEAECQKLIDKFGSEGCSSRIAALNDGIGAKGYKYKSHYHAILSWDRRDKKANPEPEAGTKAVSEEMAAWAMGETDVKPHE